MADLSPQAQAVLDAVHENTIRRAIESLPD